MSTISHCRQYELGVIRVSGGDARGFLHAQLTQNIADLAPDRSTLAAWLSAQGRVRALFDVVTSDQTFLLLTPADNIEQTLRQMRMFVLRADAQVETADDLAVHALIGEASSWLADRDLTLAPRQVAAALGLTWLGLGPGFVQVLGAPSRLETVLEGIEHADETRAELEAIRLGLPAIPSALRERYIPQMLNLEQLGAVSFKKGCYPGQEIVARTQNLGTVKRRLLSFSIGPGAAPEPGAKIVDESKSAVGEVNRSAPVMDGHELLAVVQLDALQDQLALAQDARPLELLSRAT